MLTTASSRRTVLAALALLTASASLVTGASSAQAAALPVGLGTAGTFAVLAYSTVTNTGPSSISGDIGLHPGSAVTGFPPGTQIAGAAYVANSVAEQARLDAGTAFNDASGQSGGVSTGVELGGRTLSPDIYQSTDVLAVNGTLVLDADGDSSAIWIFRSMSSLVTGSASQVQLINGADACNVYWIVPSSATLGTGSTLVGTVIASTSISANTGSTVTGRLLALNGAVTLDTTTVQQGANCSAVSTASGGITIGLASANTAAAAAAAAALAATGVDGTPLLVTASAALLAGALLLTLSRRRRARSL